MDTSCLKILQHSSEHYAPRTWANARSADVTLAFAVDYSTAGERLTAKAAGSKYLALPINAEPLVLARLLWKYLKANHSKNSLTVNIAGNGIYTLREHSIRQPDVNLIVYSVLAKVHEHWPITSLVSGGQTGVDQAGGVAGLILGIHTTMLLPKGFIQRDRHGKDEGHSESEIRATVVAEAQEVMRVIHIEKGN